MEEINTTLQALWDHRITVPEATEKWTNLEGMVKTFHALWNHQITVREAHENAIFKMESSSFGEQCIAATC